MAVSLACALINTIVTFCSIAIAFALFTFAHLGNTKQDNRLDFLSYIEAISSTTFLTSSSSCN